MTRPGTAIGSIASKCATARAGFYLYNDTADVDILADALDSATDIFGF